MFYKKSTLSNGLSVLSENMPGVRSITLGIWFKVGSRDELPAEAGISHFMEHMLFKGTEKRSAIEISQAFDSFGAEFNAFTSKEYTCFYARFVDDYLEQALEILSDMLLNSKFADKEVMSERQVVIEEIARCEDSPDDYVFELLNDSVFPTCTLGRPIVGTRQSVGGFTHDDLVAYHNKHYHAANCTVAASGDVDHEKLVDLVKQYLGTMVEGKRNERSFSLEKPSSYLCSATKDTEQAHIVLGTHGLESGDDDRFASTLMEIAFGGGMSSRLFQEVREKRGLVYAIYAGTTSYQGTGLFTIYAGTRLENLGEVVAIIEKERKKLLEDGFSAEELERTKAYAIGQSILSMESTRNRMTRMGRAMVTERPLLSIDEIIEKYREVSLEDVDRVTHRVLDEKPVIAVVSSANDTEIYAALDGIV